MTCVKNLNDMHRLRRITLGFSSHRPETVPLAAQLMACNEAIVLEEPSTPEFTPMLRGELGIEEYLLLSDFEFPAFTRRSCQLYRHLLQGGKQFFQCEPYLERLNTIHEFFAAGGRPADIEPQVDMAPVYECERRWTAALLAYYEDSLGAPFEIVVERLKSFAREDASRNRLRDALRAEAIVKLASSFATLYIEAGSLHFYLLNRLRRLLGRDYTIVPRYLSAPVIKRICGRRHALAPGEVLTLHYTYRPQFAGDRADRLAAQSLIHSRIELKEELAGDDFPHTRDEVVCAALVSGLDYADCRRLYSLIKGRNAREARDCIKAYLERNKRKAWCK